MQQLAGQVSGQAASISSPLTPSNTSIPVPPSTTRLRHREISQKLLAAYPSIQDLRIIGNIGGSLPLYLPLSFVVPSHMLEKGIALESETLWGANQAQFTVETHPVPIARQMLLLACVFQHLHTAESARGSSYEPLCELSRPPRVLARRLAETATTLVTAHDRFTTGTLEGLECLWLEVVYHEANGNPRLAWLACRRAISTLLLKGFYRRQCTPINTPISMLQPFSSEVPDWQKMCVRLAHSELVLCLALEMPPSATFTDVASTSAADEIITEDDTQEINKLERMHDKIARHLLELSKRDSDFDDLDAMLQIHTELEDATRAMPSGWWCTGSHTRGDATDDKHLFEFMLKLRAQIFHYHLLLLAVLPSMLQVACGKSAITSNGGESRTQLVGSSRNLCLNASRDLLRRFIQFRSCERTAGYYRLLDQYASQAAATLLLVHILYGSRTMTVTPLDGSDHEQHLSDRALVSEAMAEIQPAGDEEEDDDGDEDMYYSSATAKSGPEDVLPRLLALEAGGDEVTVVYHKSGEAFLRSSSAALMDEDQDMLVLTIPFVGIVSVAPQVQHGSSVTENSSLLLESVGSPIALDDEAEPQVSDSDEEGEEDDHDEDEASLMRAMRIRRSAKWSLAHYMLRPN